MKEFKLSVKERIKKRKDIEKIFSSGRTVISSNRYIRASFIIEYNSDQPNVMMAVAVGKKTGSAYWRNRLKRILRESYRLNKNILLNVCKEKRQLLKIIFSPYSLNQRNNKKISLNDIMPGVVEILLKIKSVV